MDKRGSCPCDVFNQLETKPFLLKHKHPKHNDLALDLWYNWGNIRTNKNRFTDYAYCSNEGHAFAIERNEIQNNNNPHVAFLPKPLKAHFLSRQDRKVRGLNSTKQPLFWRVFFYIAQYFKIPWTSLWSKDFKIRPTHLETKCRIFLGSPMN